MRWLLLLLVGLLAACATPAPARRPLVRAPPPPAFAYSPPVLVAPPEPPPPSEALAAGGLAREALERASRISATVVTRAVQLVGVRHLGSVDRGVPDDCSGFVRLAYQKAGIDLVSAGFLDGENAVSAIYRRARARGAVHHDAPQPGDLVFFQETYDRNRDGRRNDGLTHVGIVETIDPAGTVTFIHRGSQGIARSHFNLASPRTRRRGEDGPVLNDILRAASRGQREWLAGELFVDFASAGAL